MLVPDYFPRGADTDVKFLFLLWLEEARIPEPDIQFRRHEPVRFLQSEFPLEINLRVFVHVENDRGLVAADVFAEPRDKALRALQRFFAGNLKIDGGFGECAEEILLSEHRAQNSKDHPKQQRPLVGTRQTVTGHQCLPERLRADSSLYRYAGQGRKFLRFRVLASFQMTPYPSFPSVAIARTFGLCCDLGVIVGVVFLAACRFLLA